jgi:hypothetical protein
MLIHMSLRKWDWGAVRAIQFSDRGCQ